MSPLFSVLCLDTGLSSVAVLRGDDEGVKTGLLIFSPKKGLQSLSID